MGGILLLLISLGSCQINYLTQAAVGHLRIMNSRKSIEKILKKNNIPEEKADKLRLVLEIHRFAIEELGLPENKSYTVYSELKEDYPGWNVFCAPKYSMMPKTWCYPIAGCVVYHGYFKKEKALEFAEDLKKEDLDVYISPFTAYSTLGWFKDPILSTHLNYDSIQLAGLIIHEMAHQRFYKSSNSQISESFAVTIERAGVLHWLESLDRKDQMEQAQVRWQKEDYFHDRMLVTRNRLDSLYQSTSDTSLLRSQKDSILAKLEKDLFDGRRKLNNAWFIPISTYHALVPQFQDLLKSVNGDFHEFYQRCEVLYKN